MAFDFTKLPPAPWFVNYSESADEYGDGPAGLSIGPYEEDAADCFMFSETFSAAEGASERIDAIFEFTALARNAFDVMARRGWSALSIKTKSGLIWGVSEFENDLRLGLLFPDRFDDPFTALVRADAWYSINVEKK